MFSNHHTLNTNLSDPHSNVFINKSKDHSIHPHPITKKFPLVQTLLSGMLSKATALFNKIQLILQYNVASHVDVHSLLYISLAQMYLAASVHSRAGAIHQFPYWKAYNGNVSWRYMWNECKMCNRSLNYSYLTWFLSQLAKGMVYKIVGYKSLHKKTKNGMENIAISRVIILPLENT